MQRLSIIVPLMGDLKRLEDTLVSVLENQPERSEVIVVLNQPYDDPYDLRGEVKFVEAPQGADLVDCFACGLMACGAPIVHVMAAGFEATSGWADAALARFDDSSVAAVAPLVVDRDNTDRILSAGLTYSSGGSIGRIAAGKRLAACVATDQSLCGPELTAAFYRREVLEAVESIRHIGSQLAVAAEMALLIGKAGYFSVLEPGCIITATPELLVTGDAWCEGVANERLFRRWRAASAGKGSWVAHAALVAMECLQSPLRPSILKRLAGRCWATLGPALPKTVVFTSHLATNRSEGVIRPAYFGSAEGRPAIQSRAAG